jgi:uncharacterized protein (DUF488 family)
MNTIYTIGYGGRKIDDFLSLLQSHNIKHVVDIRLRPDKAHDGSWVKAKTNEKGIQRWLTLLNGIDYTSLIELGNVFLEFNDWADRYTSLLESSGDLLVERLVNLKADGVCLMCAEKSHLECHRLIIADYLEKNHGVKVVHII